MHSSSTDDTNPGVIVEDNLAMLSAKRRNTTPLPTAVVEAAPSPAQEKPDELQLGDDKTMRPFASAVMAPYLDLGNCTFTEVKSGTAAYLAISKYGHKDLTKANYELNSWRRKFEGWPEEEWSEEFDEYDDYDRDRRRNRRRGRSHCRDSDDDQDKEDDAKKTKDGKEFHSELELGLGVHEMNHEGSRIFVLYQEIGDAELHQCSASMIPRRSMVLFAEGRDQGVLLQSFVEMMIHRIPLRIPPKPVPRQFRIYRWCHCNHQWDESQTQQAREMRSVILPKGMVEMVDADMKEFLSKETAEWYNSFGIPYKRSYLFHGVPGSGKTSLICALAGRFKRRVCFLSAHNPNFSDDAMKRAMERLPRNSFLIMEDIDSLFNQRESMSRHSALTFTGLLNTLDGIGHAKGQIVIMTTNFLDRLDEALVRAGRADVWVEFKKASDWQLEELFKWFYHKTPEEAKTWASHFRAECRKKFSEGVTMAEMQQHFVDHRKSDAETCAKSVHKFDMPLRTLKKLLKKDENGERSNSRSRSPPRRGQRRGRGRGRRY